MAADSETNIDKFNVCAAFFLSRLYENFPVPVDLDCHEAVYGTPLPATGSNGALHRDDLQNATRDADILFATHALEWLHSTGYFRGHAALHNVRFTQAVLTAKGLEALNAIPTSLTVKATLGQQLNSAVRETVQDARRAAVSQVVGQIIGFAARGLLSPTP